MSSPGPQPRSFAELLEELVEEVHFRVTSQRATGSQVWAYVLGHDAVSVALAYWCGRFLREQGQGVNACLQDELIQLAREHLWRPFRERDFAAYYIESIGNFRSWLYTTLRNAWRQARRDHVQGQQQEQGALCRDGLETVSHLQDPRPGPLEEVSAREAAAELEAAIGQAITGITDPVARAVMHLSISRNLSQRAIALAVGRTESRVSQILKQYQPRLRTIVEQWRAMRHE